MFQAQLQQQQTHMQQHQTQMHQQSNFMMAMMMMMMMVIARGGSGVERNFTPLGRMEVLTMCWRKIMNIKVQEHFCVDN